jgi:hypothetical protein
MVEFPKYYVLKTLLGGGDVNRRTIYRKNHTEVCTFNQEMKDWSVDMAKELDVCLKALINAAD